MARAIRPQSKLLIIRDVDLVRSAFKGLASSEFERGFSPSANLETYEFTAELLHHWTYFIEFPDLQRVFHRMSREVDHGQLLTTDVTQEVVTAAVRFGAVEPSEFIPQRASVRKAWEFLVETLRNLIDGILQYSMTRSDVPLDDEGSAFLTNLSMELENYQAYGLVRWTLLESESAAERAQEARVHAELAAGVSSSFRLTGSYDTFAASNEKESRFFRRTTIFLVTAAVVIPFVLHLWLLTGFGLESTNLATLIYPLVVSGGIFGVAGYCARQSHLHRTLATWSKTISIQLQTFDGFVDPIDDLSIRDGLRTEFARRVFGPHPKLKGEPGVTASSPIIDSVLTRVSRDAS